MPVAVTMQIVWGIDAVIVQDSLHGHKGDIEAKVDEVIGNALVPPRRVLHRHFQDCVPKFVSDSLWATLLLAVADAVILVADELVVPSINGFGAELALNFT